MRTSVTAVIDGATTEEVFEHVATLDRYPAWMRMVHRAEAAPPDDGRPTWQVELRARVGPFARSKRLRMVRTVFEEGTRARFEREQDDDRDHAEWNLDARVDDTARGAELTMELEYTGELWGDSVLKRILDDEVRRGRIALQELVTAQPRR